MMHLHCLGLNHHTAPVSLREQMAFSEEQTRAVLGRLSAVSEPGPGGLSELVILSTCNRVELYAVSPEPDPAALQAFLAGIHRLHAAEFAASLYHEVDQAAARHLYRVAAGLDSLVLGEPQILGQVARALELAQASGSAGPVLSRLFQSAIHAGKRARAETDISRRPASVPSLAASLAERSVPHLDRARIAIVGAGEMAELAVEALRKRGALDIWVVNRTLARAAEFAGRWGAQVTTFEHLEQALAWADIWITSTGAPHTIIHTYQVAKLLENRPDRPLVAIDIAVPRDIDPQVGELPGIRLYDIDSLNQQLEQSLAGRAAEVPRVEAVLAQEEARFMEYFQTLDLLPLIAHLRDQAEEIRRSELEKTLRRLPDLDVAEVRRIEALTEALVKKLIAAPITRLRAEAGCPYAPQYAQVVRRLYGFETPEPVCDPSAGACPLAPAFQACQ